MWCLKQPEVLSHAVAASRSKVNCVSAPRRSIWCISNVCGRRGDMHLQEGNSHRVISETNFPSQGRRFLVRTLLVLEIGLFLLPSGIAPSFAKRLSLFSVPYKLSCSQQHRHRCSCHSLHQTHRPLPIRFHRERGRILQHHGSFRGKG